MPASIPFLVERLRAEGERTAALFTDLPADQWLLPVYTDGEVWSIRSLLAHFVSSERELRRLIEDVAGGGGGAPPDFDLDSFNAGQQRQTDALAPAELILLFKTARAEMIACVSALSEADLEKHGRHPFLGVIALGDMIKAVYRHNRMHERDLQGALPSTK